MLRMGRSRMVFEQPCPHPLRQGDVFCRCLTAARSAGIGQRQGRVMDRYQGTRIQFRTNGAMDTASDRPPRLAEIRAASAPLTLPGEKRTYRLLPRSGARRLSASNGSARLGRRRVSPLANPTLGEPGRHSSRSDPPGEKRLFPPFPLQTQHYSPTDSQNRSDLQSSGNPIRHSSAWPHSSINEIIRERHSSSPGVFFSK